jgi:hypothetical protein
MLLQKERDLECMYSNRYNHSGSTKKFSETEIINMLKFFIENTFAMLSGRVFQQTVGIPMRTNCTSLLPALFFYSYDVDLSRKS